MSRNASPSPSASGASYKRPRDVGDDVCSSSPKRLSSPPPALHIDAPSMQHTAAIDVLPWGSHASSGSRAYMEDTFAQGQAAVPSQTLPGPHFFSVFDGHGGSAVAEYLAANAEAYISHALSERLASNSCAGSSTSPAAPSEAWVGAAMGDALRDAFLAMDRDLPTRSSDAVGGSTAVCVLLDEQRIVCANCGDSRAVLARSDGVIALSDDHKPERPDEQARIHKAGGRITTNGCARVMGMLSMTRAIGDTALQRFGVSPEPEVRVVPRSHSDEFLLVASDGLWGVLSNEEAVSVARRCLARAAGKGMGRAAAARIAAKVLVHAAVQLGSRDNITVIVVDLAKDGSQPPSPHTPPHAAPACVQPAHVHSSQQAELKMVPSPQVQQVEAEAQACSQGAAGDCQLLSAERLLVQVPIPEPQPSFPESVPSLQHWLAANCQQAPQSHQGSSRSLVHTLG